MKTNKRNVRNGASHLPWFQTGRSSSSLRSQDLGAACCGDLFPSFWGQLCSPMPAPVARCICHHVGDGGGGGRGEWVEQVSVLLPTHLGLVLRISLQTWASAWPLEAGLHFLAQGPHRLSRVTQKRALCGCPQVLRCTRTDAWAGRIGVRQSHLVVRRAPGQAF